MKKSKLREIFSYEVEVRFFVVLMVLFLVLLNQGFIALLDLTLEGLERSHAYRLTTTTRIIAQYLDKTARRGFMGWSYLDKERRLEINNEISALQKDAAGLMIRVRNTEGRVTAPFVRPDLSLSDQQQDIIDRGMEKALLKETYRSGWYQNAYGYLVKSFFYPLIENDETAVVVEGSLVSSEVVQLNNYRKYAGWFRTGSIILTILLSIIYIRHVLLPYRIISKKASDFMNSYPTRIKRSRYKSDVQFVVDMFEESINSLKEKEKELQGLYAAADDRARAIELYNDYILRCIDCGVITFDKEGRITTFNTYAQQLFQLNEEDVLEHSGEQILGSDSHIMTLVNRCFEQDDPRAESEWYFVDPGGSAHHLELTASPLKNAEGGFIGVTVLIQDVTDKKEMMNRIQQKKRIEALGEMAAGIAHEFRNPLATIMGYAQMIKKEMSPHDEMHAYAKELLDNAQQLNHIMESFLNYVRPAEPRLDRIDIREFIEETLRNEKSKLDESRKIGVTVRGNKGLMVEGDTSQLTQVFVNLFTNAVEAMTEGGNIIVDIRKNMMQAAPMAEIGFHNTGTELSQKVMEKIFQPFFTTKEGGTGLGMAIVQKIIVNHNGRIEAENKPGAGPLFVIYLPAGEQVEE